MQEALEITVRTGLPADYAQLIGIDEYAVSHVDRATAIEASLAAGACLVAEMKNQFVGYAVLNYSFFGFGFIPMIVVAPLHRRRGIGLRLLYEVRQRCTAPKLFTSANSSNSVAQALFARAGFVRSGVVENLDGGDPEILYFMECKHP